MRNRCARNSTARRAPVPTAPRRRPFLSGVLLLLVLGGTPSLLAQRLYEPVETGDLTPDELATLNLLVRDFGFTDVAQMWVDARLRRVSSGSRADLDWIRVDILEAEGRLDEAETLRDDLARRYPNHRRAKASELASVQSSMLRVRQISLEAQYETDRGAREALLAQRDILFRTEVQTELRTTIDRLNKELESADAVDPEKADLRDQWEFYQLTAFYQYAELFPPGEPAYTEYYEKLFEAATAFVDERFDNLLRQYQALLARGRAHGALGRPEDAAWDFELIAGFEPPSDPPYPDEIVRVTRWLRLQGLQAAMKSWNDAGLSDRAVQVYDEKPESESFPWKADPEDAELLPFAVALDVEVAIANLGGGEMQAGLDSIRAMLDRFDSEQYRAGDPEGAEVYLADIGSGLARAVRIGVTGLPAEFLYRASVGFKRQGDLDRAIRAAQLALSRGSGVAADEFWVASSLYEIGECYDSLGLTEAAAGAFQSLATHFGHKKRDPLFETLLADAAQNWFAIAGDLASTEGPVWEALTQRAQSVFGELSRGEAGITLQMQKALELEEIGKYAEAVQIYQGIPATIDDDGSTQQVGAYHRARAGVGRCSFLEAKTRGEGAAAASAAISTLQGDLKAAETARDVVGQIVLLFEIAKIQADEEVGQREAALATLAPLVDRISGDSRYREIALRYLITLHNEVDPARPETGTSPDKAEAALAAMKSSFYESTNYLIALYETASAYDGFGTVESARRAAELIREYMAHPEAGVAESAPGVRLGFARILMDGDLHAEANDILGTVRREVGDDPAFAYIVTYLLVKSANLTDQHREALAACESFEETFGAELLQGSFEEAPFIWYQYALAHLGMREQDRSDAHLTEAGKQLESAYAIFKQRIDSLVANDREIPPLLEKERWNVFVTWLKVLEGQKLYDRAKKVILAERTIIGRDKFAPPAFQAQIDEIERGLP